MIAGLLDPRGDAQVDLSPAGRISDDWQARASLQRQAAARRYRCCSINGALCSWVGESVGFVAEPKIAGQAVGTGQIANLAVGTGQLANNAVTAG